MQKSSHLLVSNEVKQTQVHCNLGRLSKRSRHHYGHHYSRRIAGNHVGSSSSHPKNRHPSRDDRLPFKHMHQGGDFSRPERMIHFGFGRMKNECGICQKVLRRKHYIHREALSSSVGGGDGECAVVAVLVCGHMYHAECLEERTSREHMSDPECPLCVVGSISQP
ncbi:hypothetical protein LINGRAHAP2_LOCUS30940 [Linum grandiflorum]